MLKEVGEVWQRVDKLQQQSEPKYTVGILQAIGFKEFGPFFSNSWTNETGIFHIYNFS